MHGSPEQWSVLHGSALDAAFLATLEPADIVYSWGVLHHTGQMWTAIEQVAPLVRPGGLFYLALYLKTPRSGYWLDIKKRYNRASLWGKRRMEAYYMLRHVFLPRLIRLQNPVALVRDYKRQRGMDFMTDVRDWLGGYPFEVASIDEVVRFGRRRGFHLANIAVEPTLVEYLLERNPG